MQKIHFGAIIAVTALLVLTSSMVSEQSFAQTTNQPATTDNIGTGGTSCNTTPPTRGLYLTIEGKTGQNGNPCIFEIEDYSFDIEQTLSIGSQSGGAGAGKVTFNPFSITRQVDSASPTFFHDLVTGTHYNTVVLHMRKAGGTQQEFLTFTFKLVAVKTISWAHDEESPKETNTFEYGALGIQYQQQKAGGTLNAPVIGCFDVVQNALC